MHNQKLAATSIELLVAEMQVDFVSAAAILTLFAADLERRRSGCIAAISSVAGDRGRRANYVYGSAKGGLALFLQGLRSRLYPAGVRVVTIKPGPVRTPMTDQLPDGRRLADPRRVAGDIVRSLEGRSSDILYTPAIWRYIMMLVRLIPEAIFKRLSF
jgi:short-subunit dehydrogenase